MSYDWRGGPYTKHHHDNSGDIERFLAAAPSVPGGRAIDICHPLMDDVLGAVGIEVRGYMRLDEERDGQERMKPKKGSTAERLLAIVNEPHLLRSWRTPTVAHSGHARIG